MSTPEHSPTATVDADGILRRGGRWVALSPIEARLTRAFLEHVGGVASRAVLEASGWPQGPPPARAVDSRIKLLRRRVAPLGLQIHTIFRRGYLLELIEPPAELTVPTPY